jgi:hypothetical protein
MTNKAYELAAELISGNIGWRAAVELKRLQDENERLLQEIEQLKQGSQPIAEVVGMEPGSYDGWQVPKVQWLASTPGEIPQVGAKLYIAPYTDSAPFVMPEEEIDIIDSGMCGYRDFAFPFAYAVIKRYEELRYGTKED